MRHALHSFAGNKGTHRLSQSAFTAIECVEQAAKQELCTAEQLSDHLNHSAAAKKKEVAAVEQALAAHR